MLRQQVHLINNFRMVIDALAIVAAGYAACFVNDYMPGRQHPMETDLFVGSVLVMMYINNYVMGKLNLYGDRRPASYMFLVRSIIKAVAIDIAIISAGIFLVGGLNASTSFLWLFALFSLVFLMFERGVAHIYVFAVLGKQNSKLRKILVVGNYQRARIVSEILDTQESWGHEVIGIVTLEPEECRIHRAFGSIGEFYKILRDVPVDEVIFAINGDKVLDLTAYLNLCRVMGITPKILPAMWDVKKQRIVVENYQNIPLLTLQVNNFNATGLFYKRILDIIGGLVGCLFLLIIYPFVAIAIKCDSPGPVFFVQKRKGQHGRIFNLFKFRTMYKDAEQRKQELMAGNEMRGAIFKMKNDPRITRVGRRLRNTSLDEFPQFINVLKGEMSLVGTRPPTLEEVEKYDTSHLKRISVKPGITGLWQVSGRNNITDFEEIVKLDCHYLENWRFMDDIIILLKTVFVVLYRKGAL